MKDLFIAWALFSVGLLIADLISYGGLYEGTLRTLVILSGYTLLIGTTFKMERKI